jgi:hypothetical protein
MAGRVDVQKVSEWRARFERFSKAGKSVTQFCRFEGVSVPSFYQWRKKLAGPPAASGAGRAAFAAVRLVGAASVAVSLPGGTRLEIPLGDPRTLTLVIETLVRADAQRMGGATC